MGSVRIITNTVAQVCRLKQHKVSKYNVICPQKKKERKKTRTYLCIRGSRNQTSFQQQRQAITPIFPVQDYANVYNYYLGKILLQEKWTNKQKSRGGEFFFSITYRNFFKSLPDATSRNIPNAWLHFSLK